MRKNNFRNSFQKQFPVANPDIRSKQNSNSILLARLFDRGSLSGQKNQEEQARQEQEEKEGRQKEEQAGKEQQEQARK